MYPTCRLRALPNNLFIEHLSQLVCRKIRWHWRLNEHTFWFVCSDFPVRFIFLIMKWRIFGGSSSVVQDCPVSYNCASWNCKYVVESHLKTATVWKCPRKPHFNLSSILCEFVSHTFKKPPKLAAETCTRLACKTHFCMSHVSPEHGMDMHTLFLNTSLLLYTWYIWSGIFI